MKKLLLVTFDFIRHDEPSTSLAMGALLSRLKSDSRYGRLFVADHVSFNLYDPQELTTESIANTIMRRQDVRDLHAIAIGCYIWAERFVNPLILALRANGFAGKIILGGYQIVPGRDLARDYPGADCFILGYAEESLIQAIEAEGGGGPLTLSQVPEFRLLPSPYITEQIPVALHQGRVRFETKRGCIRNCRYCADRHLQLSHVYSHDIGRVSEELSFLKSKRVRKINMVDPLFNYGSTYMDVLRMCVDLGIESQIALQVCFNFIKGSEGDEFVDLCSSLDVLLEFGLQTAIDAEMQTIGRNDDLANVRKVMYTLGQRSIPYEVSLIYGLPGQTFESFLDSVRFVLGNGCTVLKSYPLKLFKGTDLWQSRADLGLSETPEGRFQIPCVTSSRSFDRQQWERMRDLAKSARRATDRRRTTRSAERDSARRADTGGD